MEETSFSGVELAGRARVAPEVVQRLVELGILRPGPGAAPFGLGDVRRVRLVDGVRAGRAVAGGDRAGDRRRAAVAGLPRPGVGSPGGR